MPAGNKSEILMLSIKNGLLRDLYLLASRLKRLGLVKRMGFHMTCTFYNLKVIRRNIVFGGGGGELR
jgi:hypothetical protein